MKETGLIIETLEKFGFSEKEVRAYLALLELGKSSSYHVAQRSGIKQSTAYVILNQLVEKGLVARAPREHRNLFIAKLPSEVLTYLESRMEAFERVLPILQATARERPSGARMIFYEGIDGIREGLKYRMKDLEESEIVGFYGSAERIDDSLRQAFLSWNKDLVKHGITTRAIVPNHPSLEEWRALDKKHQRTIKIVSYGSYSSDMSVDINNYMVRIIVFQGPQCVIIDDVKVAKTFKQIFEMVWRSNP